MKRTNDIIRRAFDQYRPAIAYSGGGDSTVLLDIVHSMGYRPPLIYADSQMEYGTSQDFAREVASLYKAELHIAKADITPEQCWRKHGFPMLGKLAAVMWNRNHKDRGFRLDVSTCCRKMKIKPARDLLKKIGCNATLTGIRGNQDDRLRGLREHVDGAICYIQTDKITQVNPLLGWTDLMISRYTRNHDLPINPQKASGALTIGCMYCGGGAQFDNSGFRVLRTINPKAWRKMIVDFGFGEIILAIKHDKTLAQTRAAIVELGGIEAIVETMPHVFDFLRHNPLRGYDR